MEEERRKGEEDEKGRKRGLRTKESRKREEVEEEGRGN